MKKLKNRIFFMLILVVVGCNSNPAPSSEGSGEIQLTQTSLPIPSTPTNVTISATPTQSPSPLPTITLATATPSSTTTEMDATIIPSEARLSIQCVDIESSFPPDLKITGNLILDSSLGFETYALNLTSGEQLQINNPNENLIDFSASPDGRWIAYHQAIFDDNRNEIGNNFVLATSDGQPYKSFPWKDEWSYVRWLDNQRMLVKLILPETASLADSQFTFLIFDPFTEEEYLTLTPDYPGIFSFPMAPTFVEYDPSLTQVAYFQSENGENGPFNFVLWEIDDQREIISFRMANDLSAKPRWSPNGDQLAIAPSFFSEDLFEKWPAYELYRVNQAGEMTQLTNLTAYYPWIYIDDFSWSPDGRYLAFWFTAWFEESSDYFQEGERQLAVLDTVNGEVTDYCVPGDYDAKFGIRRVSAPFWSPDSKQIVVENRQSEDHRRVILIDLEREIAVQIAEDMKPVGWMVSPKE